MEERRREEEERRKQEELLRKQVTRWPTLLVAPGSQEVVINSESVQTAYLKVFQVAENYQKRPN